MTLQQDTEKILEPILATFDKKFKADIAGELAEVYISGQAEMITWGETKGGIPIAYEDRQSRQRLIGLKSMGPH